MGWVPHENPLADLCALAAYRGNIEVTLSLRNFKSHAINRVFKRADFVNRKLARPHFRRDYELLEDRLLYDTMRFIYLFRVAFSRERKKGYDDYSALGR